MSGLGFLCLGLFVASRIDCIFFGLVFVRWERANHLVPVWPKTCNLLLWLVAAQNKYVQVAVAACICEQSRQTNLELRHKTSTSLRANCRWLSQIGVCVCPQSTATANRWRRRAPVAQSCKKGSYNQKDMQHGTWIHKQA